MRAAAKASVQMELFPAAWAPPPIPRQLVRLVSKCRKLKRRHAKISPELKRLRDARHSLMRKELSK